jgi:site-specific DNA recombinase
MNLLPTKRAAIYIRVSSDKQVEGYSLDQQLEICQQFCKSRGWHHIATFCDDGYSAKSTERPAFQEMLGAASIGEFDIIVVHKLDRFSRSIVDVLVTLRELEKTGITFSSASEVFDFSTPWGMVILVLIAAFAEWYLANLSEETKKGKLGRALAGEYGGRLAFGYTAHYKIHGGDGTAVPDPETSEGYRLALSFARTGRYSLHDIAKELNQKGFRPTGRAGKKRSLEYWTHDSVATMLKSRFYLGEITHKGETLPGNHTPLCTIEEWEEAQRAMSARSLIDSGVNRNTRVYLFSNIITCAHCNIPMRGTYGMNKRGGKNIERRYYRCRAKEHHIQCPQRMIRADDYEALVGEWLTSISLPSNWHAVLVKQVKEKPAAKKNTPSLKQLELKLKRTIELYQNGDIEPQDFYKERDTLKAQISAAQAITAPPPAMQQAADLLKNIPALWEVATPEERRDWIHAIASEIIVKDDKLTLNIKPRLQPLFLATGVLTGMGVVGFEPTLCAF